MSKTHNSQRDKIVGFYLCARRIYEIRKQQGETPLASLVQLVERRSPKPDVEGSSPSGRDLTLK